MQEGGVISRHNEIRDELPIWPPGYYPICDSQRTLIQSSCPAVKMTESAQAHPAVTNLYKNREEPEETCIRGFWTRWNRLHH
jgi:hypothetical protein